MPTIVKVLGFSISLTLVFTLVANLMPQVEGQAPVDKEVDLSALTMESFIELGNELFAGNKGNCTLCHNNMGRAPDILALDMVAMATQRMADERYQGKSKTVVGYLRESIIDPGIYVVKGFGKKGTHDAESPMPGFEKKLSNVEIDAIIAYLQSKDGGDVTVALPSDVPDTGTKKSEAQPDASHEKPQSAATVADVFSKFACTACHSEHDNAVVLGPGFGTIGDRLSKALIRQSIIDPNAVVGQNFAPNIMPTDFADTMTIKELEMVVAYLAEKKSPVKSEKSEKSDAAAKINPKPSETMVADELADPKQVQEKSEGNQ